LAAVDSKRNALLSIKEISKQSWAAFNAGAYDRAIACLSSARELGYSQSYIDYMAAFAQFAKADFARAFQGLSYRRQVMKDPFSAYPDWSFKNREKPTLIWAPPGLGIGAEVMHLGFMQCIKPFAETYTFAVDSRLVDRLQKMHPWANITSRGHEDTILTKNHCVTTILSLGHMAFCMSSPPIKRRRRILGASSVAVKKIRRALIPAGKTNLIGLSWRSANSGLSSRDYTLSDVHAFAESRFAIHNERPTYVSLQHKMTEAEIRTCKALKIQVIDSRRITENISEFLDVISACDSGVTATNSVIHLAGALGKNYLLLKKKDCPWEWRPAASEEFWYRKITFAVNKNTV